MSRYLITFSYDGSKFNGYQKQVDVNSVQSVLETILTKLNNGVITTLHSSGRTDSKVHAINASAHFDLNTNIELNKLKKAINSFCKPSIFIKDIQIIDDNFHARFNVIKKEYIYRMNIGEYNPFLSNYVFQYNKDINIERMKIASKYIIGTHNFKSFTKSNPDIIDYTRTIFNCSIEKKDDELIFSFIGSGFLRYMVRNLVGTLIYIGENNENPNIMKNILLSEDRNMAKKTANPEGLYLNKVFYNDK